ISRSASDGRSVSCGSRGLVPKSCSSRSFREPSTASSCGSARSSCSLPRGCSKYRRRPKRRPRSWPIAYSSAFRSPTPYRGSMTSARLEIDLEAIRANAGAIARFVAPAQFAAVIKANAYGHGIVEVARALEGRIARFCVYELAEAVVLRDAGIQTPILIMGPIEAKDLDLAHACDAQITLWDTEQYARQVASVARRRKKPFSIHVKIETGVVRLGLPPANAAEAFAQYARTPELAIDGAFSHLAAAEELDSDFTLVQLARFQEAIRR